MALGSKLTFERSINQFNAGRYRTFKLNNARVVMKYRLGMKIISPQKRLSYQSRIGAQRSSMSRVKKIIVSLIIILQASESTFLLRNDSTDLIIGKIFQRDPSRISSIRNAKTVENSTQFDSIIRKIICKVPTLTIELNETKVFEKSKRKNKLYLVAQWNPLPPRSQFLLILLGNTNAFNIDSDLKRLLTIIP